MGICDFFRDVLHVPEGEALDAIVAAAELKRLKKGELLIREGEQQSKVFFLVKGILRGYFFDANGREITDCFGVQSGTPAMPANAMDAPSSINIEALEDGELLGISIETVNQLLDRYPELWRVYRTLSENSLEYHWEKMAAHQNSAMERYQWFLNKYPDLIDRIKGKYIASFLGITPVTLSRLRRELKTAPCERK